MGLMTLKNNFKYNACNVCDKGFNTEDEIRKHLNAHQILQAIGKDSDVKLKNLNQKEIACDEPKRK